MICSTDANIYVEIGDGWEFFDTLDEAEEFIEAVLLDVSESNDLENAVMECTIYGKELDPETGKRRVISSEILEVDFE